MPVRPRTIRDTMDAWAKVGDAKADVQVHFYNPTQIGATVEYGGDMINIEIDPEKLPPSPKQARLLKSYSIAFAALCALWLMRLGWDIWRGM